MRLFTYVLVWLLCGLMACSSGKTAYRRGQYAEAVRKASERLRQPRGWGRRGHELAAEVVKRAFVNGYNQHQATIRTLSADTQRPFRWEAVFGEYETLQSMTADAQRALQPLSDQQVATDWLANYPTDYTNVLAETRELAAAERYQLAEAAFAQRQTDRLAARAAYEQYQVAQKWVPSYQQSAQRSLEAFSFAVLRVLIEPPVPTPELDRDDTWALGQAVNDNLVRNTIPSPYVHLYQPDQVEVADNGDYRLFDGQPIQEVVQFAVRNYRPYDESFASTSRTIESSKEYKVGTKRINDSTVVDIMEKIKGTVTLHTHRVEARLDLQLRALDARTDAPIWTDSDYVSTDWVGQWETFSGDSRALDSYTLITLTGSAPSSRDLFHSLLNRAGSSVVGTLRKQYKKR
ncbi:hypothetical protein ACAW74_01730 [Fibrella sp. WM1]|uniref:hypothetical protein n=1 Tax=Fibrella musci TaxID=3242485 RepID=UPI003521CE2D